MKHVCKKIADVIQVIFGYGMFICLFLGGLSFLGYLVAFVIGGETAASICEFIYKGLYPHLIRLSSTMILLGLLKMYLLGETALSGKKKSVKK